jgi:sulfatase maturation enzyme AslB (radical SAM superfamily)
MTQFLDTVSKVYLILESIKESKYRYIAIVNPENGEKIMKIKMNLEDEKLMDFLDTFFDHGFKIESITKEEFDSLVTKDVMSFKI